MLINIYITGIIGIGIGIIVNAVVFVIRGLIHPDLPERPFMAKTLRQGGHAREKPMAALRALHEEKDNLLDQFTIYCIHTYTLYTYSCCSIRCLV